MSLSANDTLKLSGAMMVTFCACSRLSSLSLSREICEEYARFFLSHFVQHINTLTNILFVIARVRRPSDRYPGRHDEDVLQRGRATDRVSGLVVSRRGVHARYRFADAETRRGWESGQRVIVDGDGVDGRGRGTHGRKREEIQTGDVGRECRDGWWRHVLEREGVEERVRSYEITRRRRLSCLIFQCHFSIIHITKRTVSFGLPVNRRRSAACRRIRRGGLPPGSRRDHLDRL